MVWTSPVVTVRRADLPSGKQSSRHHGLWVSDDDNWASYTPVEPVFSPPLTKPPSGTTSLFVLSASVDPDPVIWVQTWDHQVYVVNRRRHDFS